ncbi:TPA: TraE/TraK family type IV conjugative transfer system protein [Photobacterium damselae]
MELPKFKLDFNTLKSELNMHRIATAALSVTLLLSTYALINQKPIVITESSPLCTGIEYSFSSMSKDGHERLGTMLAHVLGNANPSNADYVKNTILKMSSSQIYNRVNNIITDQINKLKEDKVTMTFQPDTVQFEDGTVFATGKATMEGLTGKKNSSIRTYEFSFNVENYTPSMVYIDVYEGIAHNKEWRAKQNAKKNS